MRCYWCFGPCHASVTNPVRPFCNNHWILCSRSHNGWLLCVHRLATTRKSNALCANGRPDFTSSS